MPDDAMARKFEVMLPLLDERQRRIYLASEAAAIGRGGVSRVSRAAGVSRDLVSRGVREIESGEVEPAPDAPARRPGAGRKSVEESQPGVREALAALVGESTYGDPQGPLLWTTKSLRNLSEGLASEGFRVGYRKVGYMLKDMGYSLQANRKMRQVGDQHPDRDAQFRHINGRARSFMDAGLPVISVDCKKKELVGSFANGGREWAPKGSPVEVLDHDFPLPGLGKAAPYGVYDVGADEGFVNVGISADTAQFAVASIRGWWLEMGRERYPGAHALLVTADGGGSNASRSRLWKTELQALADETGLEISVCHLPPGTSKWNKVEHRMFSQISKNWRGRPLETLEVIVSLIAATTTKGGLAIRCRLDESEYPKGIKVSDEELAGVNMRGDEFHPNWNYTIAPRELT